MKKLPENATRFEIAKFEKLEKISETLEANNLTINDLEIFIRAFKKEETLEVWAKSQNQTVFKKIRSYSFCNSSGSLGPKRKEGDFQIPEGVYYINRFNENSNFYLSLGLNYPNKSDLIFGDKSSPGTDIFIHGGCQTIGCIPITDDLIKELFVIAKLAKQSNQLKIPVHIFPFEMSDYNLKKNSKQHSALLPFWINLKTIFDSFEKEKSLKPILIDDFGKYIIGHE